MNWRWGWCPNQPQPWISHCDHLAFGGYSQIAIGLVMYIKLYLLAISFLILEGDILDKLLPSTWWRSYGTRCVREAVVRARCGCRHPPDDVAQLPQHARLCLGGQAHLVGGVTTLLVWVGMSDKGFDIEGNRLLT
jgi:vesicular inhibitory amino acid transporter